MKILLVAMACVLFVAIFVTGCGSSGPTPEEKTLEKAKDNQETASKLVSHLIYVKDQRTNNCFAHYSRWSYGGYYISTIATIPCESVPTHLLITPKGY